MMDGAESVRSGRSERSHRSHHSHRHHHSHSGRGDSHSDSHRHHRKHRHRHAHSDPSRLPDENRSVSIRLPTSDDMQQLTKNDHVEVQILPQDDNWGDNTTAMTSETGWSDMDDVKMSTSEAMEKSVGLNCSRRYASSVVTGFIATLAFLSPIAMVIVPFLLDDIGEEKMRCLPDCQGYIISLTVKLVILLIGTWALFVRKPKASMPRSFVFRVVIVMLLFLLSFAYWLFYMFRLLDIQNMPIDLGMSDYKTVVLFASSMVDTLLFIHYIAIILLEIRQLQTMYTIKILRSPDGESKTYNIGQLSIQRAAVTCLEWYYRDFTVYNPYLENAIHRKSNKVSQSNMSANKFKVYDIDGPLGGPAGEVADQKSKAIFAAAARRRDAGHNERYYEEQEYERRVAKRKSRLMTAAEESFTHIKRLREESGPAIPMDSKEAADAIFPSMGRALQKFLRITRQQPAYPAEVILGHLAKCVNYDMSPRAFLEEYLSPGAVINHPKQTSEEDAWSLVSETFLSCGIDHGTHFVLKKSDISLLCVVKRMPYFNISEKVMESQDHRFVLRLNSETSV